MFLCPECDDPEYGNTKVYLRFGYSFSEQWGPVVTRHDFSRCPNCRNTFVSTNGRDPERAADNFKIRLRHKKRGGHR